MFKNILIIGFGLIGSSIARGALKAKITNKILVYDKDKTVKNRLKKAKFKKVQYFSSVSEAIKNANFIVICTPVLQYEGIFKYLKNNNNITTIVTDVGSTKSNIVKLYNDSYKNDFKFVPSHPIAGTEKSGLEHGFAELFHDRYNIICPVGNKKNKSITIVKDFWRKLGMQVDIMSAKKHDKILGLTSHLPHLIAYSLVLTAMKKEKTMKSSIVKYSAGGFRDFTRITENNPNFWRDVFLVNQNIIHDFSKSFISEMKKLNLEMKQKKSSLLLSKLEKTRKVRKSIIKAKMAGKFIPND